MALSHAAAASRLTLRGPAETALDAAERDYLTGLLKTADAVEGVQAWLEKRQPRWKS
jgi:enoyl-CoA hydratase/carnithine racemase